MTHIIFSVDTFTFFFTANKFKSTFTHTAFIAFLWAMFWAVKKWFNRFRKSDFNLEGISHIGPPSGIDDYALVEENLRMTEEDTADRQFVI